MTIQIPDDDILLYARHLERVLNSSFPTDDKELKISILVTRDLLMKLSSTIKHDNNEHRALS